MSVDPNTILKMAGVSKHYQGPSGTTKALDGVDVEVRRGDFLAITGPSGSGKTTLLNLAALLDRPTSGRLWLEQSEVSGLGEAARSALRKQKIGMVYQSFHLLPNRSVLENVLFRFRYLNIPRTETLRLSEFALEQVGLREKAKQPARLLSGGEMQRTAIARAVALKPALLLADEPTGNLDTTSTNAVMDIFKGLNAQGITIVIVTHNERLLGYCSHHLICADGSISNIRS